MSQRLQPDDPNARIVNAPMMQRAAETRPASFQEDDNSIEICWTTGARVLRYDWWDGEYYDESLALDAGAIRLGRLNAGAAVIDSHNQHRLSSVLGSVVPNSVEVSNGEGRCRVSLARTPDVADTVAKILAGHIRSVSVGYIVHAYTRFEEVGERPEMRATDWEPIEISFVIVPADAAAEVRAQPNAERGGTNFPCTIRGAAAPQEERIMADVVTAPAPTLTPSPTPTPAPVETPPAAAEPAAEARGLATSRITDVVGRSNAGDAFALELIARNEQTPMTEAQLTDAVMERIAANRPNRPINSGTSVGATGTEDETYRMAIGDAVILRADPSVQMDESRLALAREFRGMTMMELARDYLQRTGISMAGMGRLEIAGAALGLRYGAMSTSDFAIALSNAAGKRVRDAYAAAPQTFAPIVSRGTLPDFKPTNIIGLGDAPQLLLVRENAEFKYGAISDTGLSYFLSTYGRIIAITRQAIINDDKNLFGRIPAMFGRKAADLESDIVWGILTSNPNMGDGVPLFHASHGNLAGSGGAISVTTVGAGEQAMLQQTSPDGAFLSIRPEYLIVGPAKKVEAQQFLTAVSATQTSNVNPYPGTLQLIVEPRITGNQWFLAANPTAFDTIELAHLDGQEELYIETQAGFDVDGVKTKARLDVGAAPIDWRGFYKNPGN